MEATRCLRDEHQLILKVLDCFDTVSREALRNGKVTKEVFGPFVEFFQGFADRCHHCKEEDRLFPVLEKNGIPREGGPIGTMLYEHKRARRHVQTIAESLDAADAGSQAAIDRILEHSQACLDLLRSHIDKEDHCLFAMADDVVQGDDLSALSRAYREAESEPAYCDTLFRCQAIANQLTGLHHTE